MALSKQENVQVELNTKVCVPSDGFSLARNFCNEIKLSKKMASFIARAYLCQIALTGISDVQQKLSEEINISAERVKMQILSWIAYSFIV